MANLITKAALLAKVAKMQQTAALITSAEQRVCEKCLALYAANDETLRRERCYCDYESDRYDDGS